MSRIGTRKRCRRSSSGGFTLVELMLVILLIAVLTGLSVPLLRHAGSDLALKDASFAILAMVRYAQEMAVIDRGIYKLNMNSDRSAFWITGTGAKIKNKHGKIFRLPRDLRLEADTGSISFYPDGQASDAEIKILGRDERGNLLQVKGIMGTVEFHEITPG